jgi:hypothetical protein
VPQVGLRPALPLVVLSSSFTRLSYLTVNKFRMAVEARPNRARIVRNRCAPVCGHRAVYFALGLAPFKAQIRLEIEDFRPDP